MDDKPPLRDIQMDRHSNVRINHLSKFLLWIGMGEEKKERCSNPVCLMRMGNYKRSGMV